MQNTNMCVTYSTGSGLDNYCIMQAQLSQEVKRADMLSAELSRQQDDTARKGSKQRATTDALGTSRSPAGDHIQLCCDTL